MAENKFPTEVVSLPSKGLLYPKESPLSSGEIEIKYIGLLIFILVIQQDFLFLIMLKKK